MFMEKGKKIPNLATLLAGYPSRSVDYFLYKQTAFFFTTIIVFIFKTSGYDGDCDGLWIQ